MRTRSRNLDQAAQKALGGTRGYNRFEELRNNESFWWSYQNDRERVCSQQNKQFQSIVNAPFERIVDALWTVGSCK